MTHRDRLLPDFWGQSRSKAQLLGMPAQEETWRSPVASTSASFGKEADTEWRLLDVNLIIIGSGPEAEKLLHRRVEAGGRACLLWTSLGPQPPATLNLPHVPHDEVLFDMETFTWQPPAADVSGAESSELRRLRHQFGSVDLGFMRCGPDVVALQEDEVYELILDAQKNLAGVRVLHDDVVRWQLSGAVLFTDALASGGIYSQPRPELPHARQDNLLSPQPSMVSIQHHSTSKQRLPWNRRNLWKQHSNISQQRKVWLLTVNVGVQQEEAKPQPFLDGGGLAVGALCATAYMFITTVVLIGVYIGEKELMQHDFQGWDWWWFLPRLMTLAAQLWNQRLVESLLGHPQQMCKAFAFNAAAILVWSLCELSFHIHKRPWRLQYFIVNSVGV